MSNHAENNPSHYAQVCEVQLGLALAGRAGKWRYLGLQYAQRRHPSP